MTIYSKEAKHILNLNKWYVIFVCVGLGIAAFQGMYGEVRAACKCTKIDFRHAVENYYACKTYAVSNL